MSIAHSPTENSSIFNEDAWSSFVKKVEEKFELKKYPQFDSYFNFPKEKDKLKQLVSDQTGKKVGAHPFLPFVKIIVKTPRYRYQKDPSRDPMELSAKEREQFYEFEIKPRPISFASHFDTYLYGFYSFVLTEKYQDYIKSEGFDSSVLAYRTDLNGKSNIQFAKDAFDEVRSLSEVGACTAIAIDIKGYFDSIDHKILKKNWCKLLNVDQLSIDQYRIFRSLTEYSYVNKDSILKHFKVNLRKKKRRNETWQTLLDLIPDELAGETFLDKFKLLRSQKLISQNKPKQIKGTVKICGIPQGSSISAFLSNLYLVDFDNALFKLSGEMDFVYRRYCDDILIICPSHLAKDINERLQLEIDKCELEVQNDKTELIEFKKNSKGAIRAFNRKKIEAKQIEVTKDNEQIFYKNLQYLGFEFNGQNAYIRPGSLSRYFRKMKARITKTIMMARGRNSKSIDIFKAQLYHRYTHLGRKNFLNYAYKASKKYYQNSKGVFKEGLNSPKIKAQLSKHFDILKRELTLTDAQFLSKKRKRARKLRATPKSS